MDSSGEDFKKAVSSAGGNGMKIALAHFRVGETDGVSLEMDKWAKVLERMGHTVVYISGSKGNVARDTFVIEEMYYQSEQNARLKAAFNAN